MRIRPHTLLFAIIVAVVPNALVFTSHITILEASVINSCLYEMLSVAQGVAIALLYRLRKETQQPVMRFLINYVFFGVAYSIKSVCSALNLYLIPYEYYFVCALLAQGTIILTEVLPICHVLWNHRSTFSA